MTNGLIQYLEKIQSLKQAAEPKESWGWDAPEEETQGDSESAESDRAEEEARNTALINSLLNSLGRHRLLKHYNLNRGELNMIAEIYHKSKTSYELDFSARDICAMNPDLEECLEERCSYLAGLVDREILSFSHPIGHDFHFDVFALFNANYRLNGLLWNMIMGKDPIRQGLRPYSRLLAQADTARDAALKVIDVLHKHYPELEDDMNSKNGVYYGRTVNGFLDSLLTAIRKGGADNPWIAVGTKHKLDDFWLKCLMLTDYYNRIQIKEPESTTLASLLANSCQEYCCNVDKLNYRNLLAQKGLVNDPEFSFSRYSISLTEQARLELAQEKAVPVFNEQTALQLLAKSVFLSRIEPTQNLRQLILDKATRDIIESIIRRVKDPNSEGFSSWGLVGASLTGDPDVQHGCNILLHGVPGTGKTFIAGVIANELQRPLVQINANNIRNCYYGSTEKQARTLFREMRSIAKELAPVFLLNEGDQLIHQRFDAPSHSVDATENSIQSIFLEEMESFPGMIIVTSNLVSNLDPAMSRRFHYKLEIEVPNLEARIALWHLHLPATIPGASDIRVQELARDFPFTGGQIRVVVQNACHEAFLRGEKAKLLEDDLWKYADLEYGSSFEKSSAPVGFRPTAVMSRASVIKHAGGEAI